jgi:ADP-ribosylglycohydrolase
MAISDYPEAVKLVAAGMLGSAVGDALGVPVEFLSRVYLKADPVLGMRGYGTHRQPAGTWSDDTSLMLCLAESLAECGLDYADQGARFVSWLRDAHWTPHGEVFDIGITTRMALNALQAGVEPRHAGPSGEQNCSNGSLMRILPIGLYFAFADPEDRAKNAATSSRLTHGHPRCQLACAMYTEIVASLVQGNSIARSVVHGQAVLRNMLDSAYRHEFPTFGRLLSSSITDLQEHEVSSRGYVIDCLEASLWCALRANSFQDGILAAVNLGNDTDTTGAVAGALLGLRFGLDQIQQEWVGSLARIRDIQALIARFQEACLSNWTACA